MEENGIDLTDYLSNLPDNLLSQIFTFLPFEDILKLRVLSRRFNKPLCASNSSFCFHDDADSHNCICAHVHHFIMNTVLPHRPHGMIIDIISFSSSCNIFEHRHLHMEWINELFQNFPVHQLSMHYGLPWIFASLPHFQSLKVLELNMDRLYLVNLPHMQLAALETLRIMSIITYDSFDEWMALSFPSLKYIFLQKIIKRSKSQDFTIQSSNLEDLTILDCNWSGSVRIITENLRTLTCLFCEFASMFEAEFSIKTSPLNLQRLTWVGNSLGYKAEMLEYLHGNNISRALIMRETDWKILEQLFKASGFAIDILVDTVVLQFLDIDEETINSLQNIRSLELQVGLYMEGEHYISFLEVLPNLENLTLVNDPDDRCYLIPGGKEHARYTFTEAFRKCEEVQIRRIRGLKKLKVVIGKFCFVMIEAIGWVIKSCEDLEEMCVHYPSCYHEFMMKDGLLYLLWFERACRKAPSFNFLSTDHKLLMH